MPPTPKFPVADCSDPRTISLPTVTFDENNAPFATDNAVPEAVIAKAPVFDTVKVPLVLL